MLISNLMNNLNKNLEKMQKYQNQLSTSKRITRLSEDPVGVIKSLQARVNLSKTEQYQANVEDAKAWMAFTETSLMEINEMIKRAYELVLQASNDTNSPMERQAIGVELEQIRQQLINSLNSTYAGRNIYGGYNVNVPPITVENGVLKYNNKDVSSLDDNSPEYNETIRYEVGRGVYVDVSINALRVIGTGPDNMISTFEKLVEKLNAGEPVTEYIDKMKNAQEHILSLVSEIGGRTNRLDFIISRYENDIINYMDIKAKVEDIDQAEVIMYFKMQEAVYRSALSVGARIIQPSLVDFLR